MSITSIELHNRLWNWSINPAATFEQHHPIAGRPDAVRGSERRERRMAVLLVLMGKVSLTGNGRCGGRLWETPDAVPTLCGFANPSAPAYLRLPDHQH